MDQNKRKRRDERKSWDKSKRRDKRKRRDEIDKSGQQSPIKFQDHVNPPRKVERSGDLLPAGIRTGTASTQFLLPRSHQEVRGGARKDSKLQFPNVQAVAFLGRPEKKSELLIIGEENTGEEDTYDTIVTLVLEEEKSAKIGL